MELFADILSDYGIPYYTSGKNARPGWLQLDCPWCGVPGKPGLGYSLQSGACNCYKCGPHSALEVLHVLTREPYAQLKLRLNRAQLNATERKPHAGRLILPQGVGPLLKAHIRYLQGRGFDVDEITAIWRVQGLGATAYIKTPAGKRIDLAWRLFIPIIWRGNLVSWTTRAISSQVELRYISAPSACEQIPHKSVLYGADYCTHAACAIEGPIDVWRFGQGGVGLCGIGYSPAQVGHLSNYLVRGVCLDNEPEAQRRARQLVQALMPFPGDTWNFQLDSKDPGAASDNEIMTMRTTLGLI